MAAIRLSASARSDIVALLAWTDDNFGALARARYEALLGTALRDLARDPERPGTSARPEIGKQIRSYHLRHSRDRSRRLGTLVRRPRHFIFFRIGDRGIVEIVRVLHDAMELDRHMPSSDLED